MAEVHIERKSGVPWWAWLLGLLVLGLILWAVFGGMAGDRTADTTATPAAAPATETGAAGGADGQQAAVTEAGASGALPIAAILAQPADYAGQQVSGTARVAEPDSDRGFFVESGGQRMFAVLSKTLDTPDSKTDMNTGQTVRLTGTVYTADRAAEVEELQPVSAETRGLIAQQKAFLRVTSAEVLRRP